MQDRAGLSAAWFRVNFGGAGQPMVFLAAAYNDAPGEGLHSGTAAVREPASRALLGLSALAAGARGQKRYRGVRRIPLSDQK